MYRVEEIKDGTESYVVIRNTEDLSIVISPTRYLKFKMKIHRSPSTVRSTAFALLFYLRYLQELEMTPDDACALDYDKQYIHFVEFLDWVGNGHHTEGQCGKHPNNSTCNTYLKNVFRWLRFRELRGETKERLKVFEEGKGYCQRQSGMNIFRAPKTFKGYKKEEIGHSARRVNREEITRLIEACANIRDKLLLLILAETGFRIGELLGVRFAEDIDHERHAISVVFREDNKNNARAKNEECRSMMISEETYRILMCYIADYYSLLMPSGYLFVTLSEENPGKPLTLNAVYSIFNRLEKKTGIKASPHMFRHYFAYERQISGWDILLISRALGHRRISTTERYLENIEEELEDGTRDYFAGIKEFLSTREIL